MSNPEISPKPAPSIELPPGKVICQVLAVNTTANLAVPSDTLVQPPIPGHELMNFPTIAFLITHPSGDQVMFDLGTRKDFWNLPGPTAAVIDAKIPGIKIEKNVIDILVEGGVDPARLRAAIISHWHFDHIGDPRTFPETMEFVVGPGFSRDFLPGYPTMEGSPFFEDTFKDRKVNELSFSHLVVAGYRAVDYFGDGSLYVLDTPGHAVGHISALVRTTVDTFVFLGGDICHFGGSFRPTQYAPMPAEIKPSTIIPHHRQVAPFACSLFTACHPDERNARTSPFYTPRCGEGSWYIDPPTAVKSIESLTVVDANEKVLVLIAHDPGLLHTLPFFPRGDINGWYNAGWKKGLRWAFLDELPIPGKTWKFLADGTYRDGVCVRKLDGVSAE
jgi:glyoxylase-like metal-dependent hydrolase (beta-lactamase superfamily II)